MGFARRVGIGSLLCLSMGGQAHADPGPVPIDLDAPGEPEPASSAEPELARRVEPEFKTLRVHVIDSANAYSDMRFDIYEVQSREVVARGQGANEAIGEEVATFEIEPGTYKIVQAGQPFDTRVDFATLTLVEDTDYLIVVDAESGTFRGAGLLHGELPKALDIAGAKISLNLGGSLWMNQRSGVVGNTNGLSSLFGIFSNFAFLLDEGPNYLSASAKMQLNLRDAPTSGVFATTDRLEGSVLYAHNIDNPYLGPYARAGLTTRVFPGYLYLNGGEEDMGQVDVQRLDGTVETYEFGTQSNPDDLRIEVATPFAPLILQEEIGANLKTLDLDLPLVDLSVATRLGWGLRQGFTKGLLVVEGDERGSMVTLREVDDYATNGPLVGASGTINVARWLFGQADIGVMLPLQNRLRAGEGIGERLLIDLGGTAGLKFPALTSRMHASFDYSFRLTRDGFLTDKTMFDQIVMARVSLQIF